MLMDPQARQANYSEIEKGLKQISDGRHICEPLPQVPEEARTWQQLVPNLEEWQRDSRAIVDLQREKDSLLAHG
jgi:hypothetical protein